MYYKFKRKGPFNKYLNVWMYNDKWHDSVTIEKSNGSINVKIQQDDKGKYFVWKKDKYYLDEYYKITYCDLQDNLLKGNGIRSEEFTQMVLNEGIENVKLLIPLKYLISNANNSKEGLRLIKCNIVEDKHDSYKIKNNYKIRVNFEEDSVSFTREFYTCDLVSLINDKVITILMTI